MKYLNHPFFKTLKDLETDKELKIKLNRVVANLIINNKLENTKITSTDLYILGVMVLSKSIRNQEVKELLKEIEEET